MKYILTVNVQKIMHDFVVYKGELEIEPIKNIIKKYYPNYVFILEISEEQAGLFNQIDLDKKLTELKQAVLDSATAELLQKETEVADLKKMQETGICEIDELAEKTIEI